MAKILPSEAGELARVLYECAEAIDALSLGLTDARLASLAAGLSADLYEQSEELTEKDRPIEVSTQPRNGRTSGRQAGQSSRPSPHRHPPIGREQMLAAELLEQDSVRPSTSELTD